jgi:hypothetical protein
MARMRVIIVSSLLALSVGKVCAQSDVKSFHANKRQHSRQNPDNDNDEDNELVDRAQAEYEEMAKRVRNMPISSSGLSVGLPLARDGSGTTWQPDATPVHGFATHIKKWMFLFDGNIFPRYEVQDLSKNGIPNGSKWDAPDMLKVTIQRETGGKGVFRANVMLSTDALIDGQNGYPLLYQTGTWVKGNAITNYQGPHDLLSELSASYSFKLSYRSDVWLYVGYPGSPALGPAAYMQRPSGAYLPDAPIGYRQEDGTMTTWGVATIGYRFGRFRLEGSSFTGRQPDDNYYNFGQPLFDSWSVRLSCNPTENWSLQASHGFLTSPEAMLPGINEVRNTASATCVYPLQDNGRYFSGTALWSINSTDGVDKLANAALAEGLLKLEKWAIYARYEWVQKADYELDLVPIYILDRSQQFDINVLTAGAAYDLFRVKHIVVSAGGQLSVYESPAPLQSTFGAQPLSAEIYLHLRPALMNKL